MLPRSLPGVFPSLPQEELQLPSLQNFDPKRKRKTHVESLPSLGSLGARGLRSKSSKALGSPSKSGGPAEELRGGLARWLGAPGAPGSSSSSSREKGAGPRPPRGSLEELLEVVKTIEEECLLDPERERAAEKEQDPFFREIEAVHKMSKGARGPPGGFGDEGRAAVSLADLAAGNPVGGEAWGPAAAAANAAAAAQQQQPEELTEEDEAVLQRWKERDKQFDAQVAQIGDAIDRIAEVAVTIGQQAEQHSQKAEELAQQTQQAAAELQQLDAKLKAFMKSQSSSNFCCKLILLLLVMLLGCFVFSTIYARYMKKA
ncbi:hypothetical protein, conserved [Eimeria tenella]|uniref:t-SNARE coiled-coil homology domain-containing protein n=1 Tax=Eimeria tenella TaxID=5802 RepID=U6KYH8_EIMTE|nr:hypothetical protein, conserved [Eimeria tenella]CDJ41963.1 hypothetical protein, conserved [Eimeria tenella]|eukprot:XP_013232713.1 hypothetical protein, conserved [Eimeria tenella]